MIKTLANIDINLMPEPYFEYEGIRYIPWEFNIRDGWTKDAWLAETEIEAPGIDDAHQEFRTKLLFSTSRVSLIAQCYTEFLSEGLLIHRLDTDMAYVQHVFDQEPVPLHFSDKGLAALTHLGVNPDIPSEFFYYWNDATNATGYTAKLLLLFSAVEALCKDASGKLDKAKRAAILDTKYDTIFYENGNKGLRHRLVHGEYMQATDTKEDYIQVIHKAIVNHFNKDVFGTNYITEDVVGPQRNLYENKASRVSVLKPKTPGYELSLKAIMDDFDISNTSFRNYEDVFGVDLKTY